jgi:hypothetical protein
MVKMWLIRGVVLPPLTIAVTLIVLLFRPAHDNDKDERVEGISRLERDFVKHVHQLDALEAVLNICQLITLLTLRKVTYPTSTTLVGTLPTLQDIRIRVQAVSLAIEHIHSSCWLID